MAQGILSVLPDAKGSQDQSDPGTHTNDDCLSVGKSPHHPFKGVPSYH